MDDPDQGFAAAVEFPSDANVTRAIIGLVRARDVHLTGVGGRLRRRGRQLLDPERWSRPGARERQRDDP